MIDHHRRDRGHLIAPLDESPNPAVPGPEAQVTTSTELSAALATLSDRDLEVLALRFGGDLSNTEIAELLDLSLSNVQQIVSRSLRKLRTQLQGSENAP